MSQSNTTSVDAWPSQFILRCLRRRGTWICTLPPQVWDASFLALEPDAELAHRRRLESARKATHGNVGYRVDRDVIYKHGAWYYRDVALSALRDLLASPLLVDAIIHALHAAQSPRQTLIVKPRKAAPTPAERALPNGQLVRGAAWSPREDEVLSRWFGRHLHGPNKGRHAPLTELQWASVLASLDRRTRSDVRRRVRELNHRLRIRLLVDGFMTRQGVERYQREALGEREPRVPRRRPRLGGQLPAPPS